MDAETTNKRVGPWEINRVHNVDSAAALREMPNDCLDVIVTSPPYWGQRGSQGIGSEEDPREYVAALVRILTDCVRCLKPSGTLWLNVGDAYNTPINWREDDHRYSTLGLDGNGLDPTNSAYTKKRGARRAFIDSTGPWLQYGNLLALPYRIVLGICDRGALYRGEVIWEKSRPMPEGICRRPHRRHESIYILAKSERHYFRVRPPVGSVWRLVQTPNNVEHCSTFPLDLPIQCISASGVEGRGVIFDPFMGSGTTALAAQQLDHDWLGFELDADHCALANKRAAATNGNTLFNTFSVPQR
jgi:DNA modification methylase